MGHGQEVRIRRHMEVMLVEHLIHIDIGRRHDVDIPGPKLKLEVHHKQPMVELRHIQPVHLIEAIIHQMRITNIHILLIPIVSALEVITIDVVDLVEFVVADGVEVEGVDVDAAGA